MKHTYEIVNQTEWKNLRSKNVNSTEVAALFGVNRWCTEFELWHQKKNGEIVEIEENEQMRWGKRFEPVIAHGLCADFKDELNTDVVPLNLYVYDDEKRIGSSFDFAVGATGLLEIKLVTSEFWFKQNWLTGEDGKAVAVPMDIELQVQHQLAVTEKSFAYVGAWGAGRGHLVKLERNEKVISEIFKRVASFWESIREDSPPAPNFEKDAKRIQGLFANSTQGKEIELSQELFSLGSELHTLREKKKKLILKEDELKAKICQAMGDASIAKKDKKKISAPTIPSRYVTPKPYTSPAYRRITVSFGEEENGE